MLLISKIFKRRFTYYFRVVLVNGLHFDFVPVVLVRFLANRKRVFSVCFKLNICCFQSHTLLLVNIPNLRFLGGRPGPFDRPLAHLLNKLIPVVIANLILPLLNFHEVDRLQINFKNLGFFLKFWVAHIVKVSFVISKMVVIISVVYSLIDFVWDYKLFLHLNARRSHLLLNSPVLVWRIPYWLHLVNNIIILPKIVNLVIIRRLWRIHRPLLHWRWQEFIGF